MIKNGFRLYDHLVMTSVHDCQVSLGHQTNADALREVLAEMDANGINHKTRRKHIEHRIRQLEKNKV